MNARELRWRRSLRRLVLTALASPICAGGAGAIGCHASSEGEGTDASADAEVADPDAARSSALADAAASDADVATRACDPEALDAAGFEGDADGCADFRRLPCGVPPDAKREDCYLDLVTCAAACGTTLIYYCQLAPGTCSAEGGIVPGAPTIVDCVSCAGASGRRPLGLCAARSGSRTRSPIAAYFASMAHLEAASVRAFRDLARWLGAHRAPVRLARAARRAADDETRHARAVARLARRFGASPARPRVRAVPPPSLAALLEDDAVEGCEGETFGALVATWQAERAGDPRVRRTLKRIAIDETRHAALAWEILAWGAPRLAAPEQLRLRLAFERALVALGQEARGPSDATTQQMTGYPAARDLRRLARDFARHARDEWKTIALVETAPPP